jgi:hypothetical protein
MNRQLAWALIAIMLLVVAGQALQLSRTRSHSVAQIQLNESRLLPLLQEIRKDNPNTYDSTVLNLQRIRDAHAQTPGQGQAHDIQLEEAVVAEHLLARLAGQQAPTGGFDLKTKPP